MNKLKGVKNKKKKKKRTNPTTKKFSLIKKLTMSLYIVIAILSIINHKIDNWGTFITELVVYIGFAIMLIIMLKNVSIKQFKEEFKFLFE